MFAMNIMLGASSSFYEAQNTMSRSTIYQKMMDWVLKELATLSGLVRGRIANFLVIKARESDA